MKLYVVLAVLFCIAVQLVAGSFEDESKFIEKWVKHNKLNRYGDPQGTMYLGGSPLFNETTSESLSLYSYLLLNHPTRPWLQYDPKCVTEEESLEDWISTNKLNKYGDSIGTSYLGGTPLFNETTGVSVSRYEYIVQNHPTKPWLELIEDRYIQQWILTNNLNEFGDPKDTHYAGGNPLFDMKTGSFIPLKQYLVNNHPTLPWLQMMNSAFCGKVPSEESYLEKWITENNFNEYGDPMGTFYMGGTPLYDESSGEHLTRYEYITRQHPTKPWLGLLEDKLIQEWITWNGLNEFGDEQGTMYIGGNPLFDMSTAKYISLKEYVVKTHPTRPWLLNTQV